MKADAQCPFCRVAAATGCPHLALAADPRDFVARCVALAQAQTIWPKLTGQNPSADFLWLETDFCENLLRPLAHFSAMEYEWHLPANARRRQVRVLLWSRAPQKLWWELRDRLEGKLASEPPVPPSAAVYCPVCGVSPVERECEHLALHGEDLTAADIVAFYDPRGAWQSLKSHAPATPDAAAEFLAEFSPRLPALVRVDRQPWAGRTLGFERDYLYVWVVNAERFQKELGSLVRAT